MKIKEDILKVLSESEISGNEVRLTGNLDRKTYVEVNKILEVAGGKWNKKAKAHIFPTDAADRLDIILLTGEVEIPKDDFDFFPTPIELAERVADLAEIGAGMEVLEPSAGHGALVRPAMSKGGKVTAYEIAVSNYDVLCKIDGLTVMQDDFITVEPEVFYDRILMNPPFGRQNDIKHVNHALKFLKPEGILVAIMANSVLWRDNKLTTEFRNFIYSKGGTIEKLPDASFKQAGTMVGTVIVKVQI